MSPTRIQRKRTKGWRMPPGAVYVGRPSRWGNRYATMPVRFGQHYPHQWCVAGDPAGYLYCTEVEATARSVDLFRHEVSRPSWAQRITELRGRDLACWCPLDQPCHADVLLALANGSEDA